MNYIRIFTNLIAVALFLALVPAALAHNTWYVDGVNGNDNNDCKSPQTACQTIGHAISLASSGDTIKVAPATYTENLTISISLKIIGSGATTTIVDGNQAGTVFTINNPAQVVLSNLTIQNGSAGYYGGGIWNNGTLAVTDSVVTASYGYYGAGGINSYGTLTITRSTISGNSTTWDGGGILTQGGTAMITDSTVSGNGAGNSGGGINAGYYSWTDATLTISNSTISENGGGGICNYATLTINNSTLGGNGGGGIYQGGGSVTLQNSILSKNHGRNCTGTMTSSGYNLSSDKTCNFSGPGDLNDTKAKLAALGNYGGPTQTIKEVSDSPTVDAGNPNGCTDSNGNLLTKDQRGFPRPGAHKTHKICDMGAFERQTD